MNRSRNRLLILILLVFMVFLISSCGSQSSGADAEIQNVSKEDEALAQDEAPAQEEALAREEAPATEKSSASLKESPAKESAAVQTPELLTSVMISIIGDEKKGVILEPTYMEWHDGDNVLDVLKQVTKAHRIPLEYRGSGMLSYVEGIANLYEFDQGAGSGWLFKINGQFAEKSAGAVKLNKGDVVEWIYSVELSEEPEN